MTQAPEIVDLTPLPYHQKVVKYLKASEPELWKWASSVKVRDESAEEIRTEMLKANYRIDAEGHPELVARCATVAGRLGVSAPVTLYQSTSSVSMNAGLYYSPGEAHIIFSGPILAALKEEDIDAVLAHELAHFHLWDIENGDYLVADRLLLAAANDPRSTPSHTHTARRFRLYTEIYADRGSFIGCGQLGTSVEALLKTETSLSQISAASYLRQANEIFSKGPSIAQGIEHPETFIRARALQLWTEGFEDLDNWLKATIEGPLSLDELDLLGQEQFSSLTRQFLEQLLRPKWFQSPPVLAHARSFFPDFSPAEELDTAFANLITTEDGPTREYLCYLLIDFAVADRELDDVPLAAAVDWAERLGVGTELEKLISKELGISKRQLSKLKKESSLLLKKAEASQ